MITTQGIEAIAASIANIVSHAEMTYNAAVRTVNILRFETIGNKIRILVYFDELTSGTITKIVLIDNAGKIFIEKIDVISKTDMQGIMFAFDINISEVV